MRVNFRMRAPTPRAILAAFAIGAVTTLSLAGCGQKGPLYMPNVPPLPQKPNFETQPGDTVQPTPETASGAPASGVQAGELPDTSGTPLMLSPDAELKSAPAAASDAQPASAAAPAQ